MSRHNSRYVRLEDPQEAFEASRGSQQTENPRYEPYRQAGESFPQDVHDERNDNPTSYGGASELQDIFETADYPQTKLEGSDPSDKLPLWRAVRLYPRLVAYCFAVTTSILGWGYMSVLISSVNNVDQFLHHFGEEMDGE